MTCNNGFWEGDELNVKCSYVGYSGNGYHIVRVKWYPDAIDNNNELKLVHESIISRTPESVFGPNFSIHSDKPKMQHTPSLLQTV